MVIKNANVLVSVEPDIKEQAEAIMMKLGVPASIVINTLYKQIIMTKSIPFPVPTPEMPMARDEIDSIAFNAIMPRGLDEAKADRSRHVSDVFSEMRQEIR